MPKKYADVSKLLRHNGVIEEIGFWYSHRSGGSVRIQFNNTGGTCSFYLGVEKPVDDFIRLFKYENGINIDDGFYLEKLVGRPLIGWFDNNQRIRAVSSFMDERGEFAVEV